jgi:hypothetical protein
LFFNFQLANFAVFEYLQLIECFNQEASSAALLSPLVNVEVKEGVFEAVLSAFEFLLNFLELCQTQGALLKEVERTEMGFKWTLGEQVQDGVYFGKNASPERLGLKARDFEVNQDHDN